MYVNKKQMSSRFLPLENLAPTGFIGFWVLVVGLIFTGVMFYFVFFKLNEDNDSYKDRKRKNLAKERQKERIASLYPKEN